ncbi:MAG: MFS transporter [Halobacteriales archaeon]
MLYPGRCHHRDTVLCLCAGSYFGMRFVEFAISIVFEDIKTALGISTFVIGLAVAASTITYAAVQLPSGALGDRFGERSVILGSLGLTGLSSLIVAGAPTGVFIVIGMAVIGLVSGAYYNPATSLLDALFDETRSAIGIHRVVAQLVGFSGPIVAFIVAGYGWRSPLVLAAGITGLLIVGWLQVSRHRSPGDPSRSVSDRLSRQTIKTVLSRPSVRITTIVAAAA